MKVHSRKRKPLSQQKCYVKGCSVTKRGSSIIVHPECKKILHKLQAWNASCVFSDASQSSKRKREYIWITFITVNIYGWRPNVATIAIYFQNHKVAIIFNNFYIEQQDRTVMSITYEQGIKKYPVCWFFTHAIVLG